MTPTGVGDGDHGGRQRRSAAGPALGSDAPPVNDALLSVILPAYNEADHIRANLLAVHGALSGIPHQLVVVDDGSSDTTFEESLKSMAAGVPVSVLRQPANCGKGAALARGFGSASGDLVAFLDSDLEIPPDYLLRLIEVMQERGSDVVIGVREEDPARGFPVARRALSRGYRWLVSWLFGLDVRETQAGIKLFRREVLEDCVPRLTARRFAFDVELLAACRRFGYVIAECPVRAEYARAGAIGRMTTGQIVQMLPETLGVYYRSSFWKWLQPGLATKLWMIALGCGIFLFGVGVAKLLTPLVLHGPVKQTFAILALQFMPRTARDWLLVVVGLAIAVASIVHLNRSLMDAFARVDRGDLAGILQVRADERGPQRAADQRDGAAGVVAADRAADRAANRVANRAADRAGTRGDGPAPHDRAVDDTPGRHEEAQ